MSDSNGKSELKIGVVFYGITGSLTHTIESIQRNIISTARQVGTTFVACHFFDQKSIWNPRTNEFQDLIQDEYKLLKADHVQIDAPEQCLSRFDLQRITNAGDIWGDNCKSIKNILHQLYSLDLVTATVIERKSDIVLFCRPDLLYHDNFGKYLSKIISSKELNIVGLPLWQWHGGYNDRFAIVKGEEAIKAYGSRVNFISRYLDSTGKPLHSEGLLKYVLEKCRIPVLPMEIRATRVRANGEQQDENFSPFTAMTKLQYFLQKVKRL
jgi:hypothetical protein